MNLRGKIVLILSLLVVTIYFALYWRAASRGPMYQGRSTSEWVEQALHDKSPSIAFETVLKIGAPAVPFIARQGFYGLSHDFHFLSSDRLEVFGSHHPRLRRWLRLNDWDECVGRHGQACWLLSRMGTNAQAAIPDVISCLEHCPSLHYINTVDLLDTLGAISGHNPAAIPYLTKVARQDSSLSLQAAAIAYQINGRTNLIVETFCRMAGKDPEAVLNARELFWFRDDHELNRQIIPLLVKMYFDPQLTAKQHAAAFSDLEDRTNDIPAAVAKLLKAPTPLPPPSSSGR